MKYVNYEEFQEFIDAFYGLVFLEMRISDDGKDKLVIIDSGVRKGCVIAVIEDHSTYPTYSIDKSWLD